MTRGQENACESETQRIEHDLFDATPENARKHRETHAGSGKTEPESDHRIMRKRHVMNADNEQNRYGRLCTEMYEILHAEAPQDELDFYLSYARSGMRILEPLCGSGRFLVPFMKRGFDITGVDLSEEMLAKLLAKAPDARAICADMAHCPLEESFDYIFIPSGSLSLFTDESTRDNVISSIASMLSDEGVFVFAVDAVTCAENSRGFVVDATVETSDGRSIVLKSSHRYDEQTRIQHSPGIYELYDGDALVASEPMDFKFRLYECEEMRATLARAGFGRIEAYSSFAKTPAGDEKSDILLFECKK